MATKRARTETTGDIISQAFGGRVPEDIKSDLYRASVARDEVTKETYERIKVLIKETFGKEEDSVTRLQGLLEEREKTAAAQIKEYKAERDLYKARLAELEEQVKVQAHQAEERVESEAPAPQVVPDTHGDVEALRKEMESMKAERKAEKEQMEAEKERLALEKAELEAIYSTEVEHSKSLKDELRDLRKAPGATVSSSSGTSADTEGLSLAFVQDLTNFFVHSVKRTPEGELYNCVLHRFESVQGGSLSFKLFVALSGEVTYTPQLSSADTLLFDLLPSKMQKEITFASELLPVFFKNLFFALNGEQE